MCGCGDSEDVFKLLDRALLGLIVRRAKDLPITGEVAGLPKVPARWTPEDADVGEIESGWGPNKQQRSQMYAQKLNHEKERRTARRQRREVAKDWVAAAAGDLEEARDYLKQYGVKGCFPSTITKL